MTIKYTADQLELSEVWLLCYKEMHEERFSHEVITTEKQYYRRLRNMQNSSIDVQYNIQKIMLPLFLKESEQAPF